MFHITIFLYFPYLLFLYLNCYCSQYLKTVKSNSLSNIIFPTIGFILSQKFFRGNRQESEFMAFLQNVKSHKLTPCYFFLSTFFKW